MRGQRGRQLPERVQELGAHGKQHVFERFALFLQELVPHIPTQEEWLTSAAENFRLR